MANDINTSVTADVNFRPSTGETVDEYTSCLSQALRDFAVSDEVKSLIKAGTPITINIEGMPSQEECTCDSCECNTPELEDVPNFNVAEFLDCKISEFVDTHKDSIFNLGAREFKNVIYSFFEDLTETPLRKKKAAVPSDMAKRFMASL